MPKLKYKYNDANAIYSRMVLHGWKNASMKWARRLAKKFASANS